LIIAKRETVMNITQEWDVKTLAHFSTISELMCLAC